MSHLGRPEEGVYDEEFSLAPVAQRLSELLGYKVRFEKDWLGRRRVSRPAKSCCCENVRFNKGEKKDKEDLAQQDGRAVRRLRDGRLRHRASRRGEHARRGALRQGRLRRSAADERADRAGDARWKSRSGR